MVLHAEHSIKSLQAGFHVCEAPLAIHVHTIAGVRLQAAEKQTAVYLIKQNRYNPRLQPFKKYWTKEDWERS